MDEVVKQAFIQNPFGVLAGFALILFAFYFGMSLLFNGWPKFGKK